VVLRADRIAAAGCVFPVSHRELADRSIGLRHRAGIGLTEESDAITIVVSEETGNLSLCHNGGFERDLEEEPFRTRLHELLFLKPKENEGSPAEQLEGKNRLSPSGDGHLVPDQKPR